MFLMMYLFAYVSQIRETNMQLTDNLAFRFPVSIKGVIYIGDSVVLLENERDEFELPGGKLEVNEQPQETLIREIKEELSIDVEITGIVDSWLYHINAETHVVIITYHCKMKDPGQELKFSDEHKRLYICPISELNQINIPSGYVESINASAKLIS